MIKTVQKSAGFTLIELLIVIAILAILAGAVLVAINPGKRTAQARDAIRKSDINAIANALVVFKVLEGYYPGESRCDSSIGETNDSDACPWPGSEWPAGGPYHWEKYNPGDLDDRIHKNLILDQQVIKALPEDPRNNTTYYYRYEPTLGIKLNDTDDYGDCPPSLNLVDCYYWIGTRLENVDSPSKVGKLAFRCTDIPSLGPGCKEVEYLNATGTNSFDKDIL